MKKLISLFLSFCLVFTVFVPVFTTQSYSVSYSYSDFPAYSGQAYTEINGDIPSFTATESEVSSSFEIYGDLDELGRCTYAYACIGQDLMPTESRGSISSVYPTGWQSTTYDIVPAKYLYNRCHLIGWQLTGENANKKNLITGTRYLNIDGMLSFEDMVADYVKSTDNHVLYRVTPVFSDNELVARGVVMEGYSVEDKGESICFNVFCYNVQPGITINYYDGTSTLAVNGKTYIWVTACTFIINTGTKKFHMENCSSASTLSPANSSKFTGKPDELINFGYSPCGRCHPEKSTGQSTTYYYGDVDLDGTITAADSRLALRNSVNMEVLSELQFILADVDETGAVMPSDARTILRASIGLEIIK